MLHLRRYRRVDLHALARASGLDVVRSTAFVTVLLPALLASRLRRRTPENYDPVYELMPGRRLNTVLERLLDIERRLIERGLSLGAGGSLLVIARKPITDREPLN
jgi:hypothetical protein